MTKKSEKKSALILGASRGLGLAVCEELVKRGWHVIGTERKRSPNGLSALAESSHGSLKIETVDVNDAQQVKSLRTRLADQPLDLLFVNAGVGSGAGDRVGDASDEEFMRVMKTNALSPMRLIEAFESLVPAQGTIGVMSSGLASVAGNETGGWEVYRASKAALNTFMRSYVARNPRDSRTYFTIAPGWVRTDMGGPDAPLSIDESIPGVVDILTAPSAKPGLRFLNYKGETLPW